MEKAAEGTVKNVETELAGAEIRDNIEPHNEGVTFEPLFDSESVTEAELKGEDATGEEQAAPEPTGEDADKKAAEPEKPAVEPEKKVDEKKDEKEVKAELPKEVVEDLAKKEEHIAGLNTALTQERQTSKKLKQEIQRLSSENRTLKTPKSTIEKGAEKFKDFKVLNEEEYNTLLEEDPDEANRYLYKFNQYRDYQSEVHRRQLTEHQAQSAEREIVNYGLQQLEKILPGVTQGKNEMAGKLTDFAVKQGVDAVVLSVLSDPGTKIVTADGENLLLGEGAAQFVQLIKSTYEAVSKVPDAAKLRTEIEAELRPKIEAEVQEKLIKKLKQDPSGNFRSLDRVAGSSDKDAKPITGIFTESDYAKMTEAEQRAALGG